MTTYGPKVYGSLDKMASSSDRPIRYFLEMEQHVIDVNALLHRKLRWVFVKKICVSCGKEPSGNLIRGFCYNCYQTSPLAGRNIFHPEESKAHLDIEVRDLAWEKKLELQPHIVYLAASGGPIKVGVTREQQALTRWIDQGASSAIVVAEVPNRYLAGVAEVALKKHFSDKTNWREMLKNTPTSESLLDAKKQCFDLLPSEIIPHYLKEQNQIHSMEYPVHTHPQKPQSVSLEKAAFEGVLLGIKGQYLLFSEDRVLNLRRHAGIYARLEISSENA